MLNQSALCFTADYSVSKTIKAPPKRRTKKDYYGMVKAVRNNFKDLSIGNRYLYEILTEYDFQDEFSGYCKGYIFPSVEQLAEDCACSVGTIYRFLKELRKAHLIRVTRRQNSVSYIYLLDVPEEKLS